MSRTYKKSTPSYNQPAAAYQYSEYRKAIQARKARQLAADKAAIEKESLHYTTEGDFCHLARPIRNIRIRG